MTTGGSTERRLAILVITFLCGVLGGLVGIQWWYVSLEWRVLSVALGAVVGTAVAFLLLTVERPRTGQLPAPIKGPTKLPRPERRTPPAPIPQATRPRPAPRPAVPIAQRSQPEHPPVAEHSRIALPQPPGNPAPSTSDGQSDLIAQCPRCGEFRLDVSEVARAYAFQCLNKRCGNRWSWTPDAPWPPVVVRRNLPSTSAPDGAGARWG